MTTNTNRSPFRDLAALGSAALLAISGDYLFWGAWPGIALGIFALLAAGALFLNRPNSWNRNSAIALLLLVPTAAQTGIEQSFSNLLVLVLLGLVLFGETSFPGLRAGWPRWSEAIWNFCKPISGWLWFGSCAKHIPSERKVLSRGVDVLLRIALPTLALGALFALLLGVGNAILGHWLSDLLAGFFAWLKALDLSFGRFVLWVFLGTFALTLLGPAIVPEKARIWTRAILEFSTPARIGVAMWRTVAILALLNVLFFAANTADALYLWTSAKLPAGVSYSEFVHSGVWSLSAAVILSAVVLVSLFQQSVAVRGTKLVRWMSLAWIAQNLVLISGVLLRLLRYVEAYQLSELRIYVGCFLLLVTFGFGTLVIHVLVPRGFNRLLFQNILATFALFFVLQFLDVAKWVAQYNVARWQNDRSRVLDVCYLNRLGASATRSLIEVAETPDRSEAHEAFETVQLRKTAASALIADSNWRSYQARRTRHARWLLAHDVRTRN